MRGFKAVKKNNETLVQRSMKQSDYESLERLYKHDNERTIRAKIWFRKPAYCIGEKREQWEQMIQRNNFIL